jgi:hypothetical protein
MTLLEVLLTMAIFLVGSVGIIGLFVAASVLHKDAVDRRTASYIAETLMAKVQATPLRDIYAKSRIYPVPPGDPLGPRIAVYSVRANANNQAAGFPGNGFVLLEGGGGVPDELAWYGALYWAVGFPQPYEEFGQPLTRNIVGGGGAHPDNSDVLAMKTWVNCLTAPITAADTTFVAYGQGSWLLPSQGYLVIDKEWMPYSKAFNGTWDQYTVRDLNSDGVADRGFGRTTAAPHNQGAPVMIAKEFPGYPGFYYTLQYYPVNATGAESRVIVSIGYGPETRFRTETFEGVYTPNQY